MDRFPNPSRSSLLLLIATAPGQPCPSGSGGADGRSHKGGGEQLDPRARRGAAEPPKISLSSQTALAEGYLLPPYKGERRAVLRVVPGKEA